MSRSIPFLLVLALPTFANADTVTNFEDLGLAPNSYLNNAGPSGFFVSGGNSFDNSYSAPVYAGVTYPTWSGWAISSTPGAVPINSGDTMSPPQDYNYQYDAYPGSGAGGSQTYAVADTGGSPGASYLNLAAGTSPKSIAITNTMYTYMALTQGDGFARAFGPGDYYLLDITGYSGPNETGNAIGDVNFYLANFLDGNSLIVSTWDTVDLSSLAGSQSLQFSVTSTDNGEFGINTPAYFAADDFVTETAVPEPATLVLTLAGLFGVGFRFRMRGKMIR